MRVQRNRQCSSHWAFALHSVGDRERLFFPDSLIVLTGADCLTLSGRSVACVSTNLLGYDTHTGCVKPPLRGSLLTSIRNACGSHRTLPTGGGDPHGGLVKRWTDVRRPQNRRTRKFSRRTTTAVLMDWRFFLCPDAFPVRLPPSKHESIPIRISSVTRWKNHCPDHSRQSQPPSLE